MPTEKLIRHIQQAAGLGSDASLDGESLIGVFQSFRPLGRFPEGLFEGLREGAELETRLNELFLAAGDGRRPQGGRDAYFLVRRPPPLDPLDAESLATDWLSGIRTLASVVGATEMADSLDRLPVVRVLEGIPPKHPKLDHEKSKLLKTLQKEAPTLVEKIDAGPCDSPFDGPVASTLRPAFYFTACDAMLRDYLMWPLYAAATGLTDPLKPYFHLWRHGVKYRVFSDEQIDLYLPRRSE